jgi:hypothetical protein
MAIASGPRGINDGLIYFIDPSNVKSYAGVGTVIYDLSGNGKTSYFTNGALYQNYQKGVVLVDGNNDYISTPIFNLTSPVTVSAWVKNVILYGNVFGGYGVGIGYANGEYIFSLNGSSLTIQGNNSGFKTFQVPQYNLNEWVHLTMTRDVGNNMRVYLNGIGSTSNPQNYSNTLQTNQIGRYSNFTNQYNARGSIGEVRIYNRALSQQEIINNYNSSRKKYLTSEEYVKDSLVLNLDFANPLCYSGTGVTAYDLSGFGHTTYLINGATHFMGYGGIISCDGVDDYIEVPTTSNLVFGSDNFSVEYWYRKTEYTLNYENIWGVTKWNTGGSAGSNEWDLAIGNGFSSSIGETVGFGIESGNTIYSSGPLPASYNLNKFNHLVGIRNNNQLQVYYNGQQIYSNTPVGMTTSTSVNNVNRNLRVSNSALNQYYSRAISGVVRIYRKALTADEVRQNYRALLPRYSDVSIITDGLILHYDFGTVESYPGTGSLVQNLLGTGLTGTLINGPTYSTNSGGSIYLDGINDYIGVSNNSALQPANLTLEFWFKLNVVLSSQPTAFPLLLDKYTLSSLSGYRLLFDRGSDQLQFSMLNSVQDNMAYIAGAGAKLSTNWNCVHGTFDGTKTKIYLNGVLEQTLTRTFTISYNNEDLYLGTYYEGSFQHYINAYLGKLVIYNRALTETEIAQNYNAMRNRFGV